MKKQFALASFLAALTLPAAAEGFYALGDVGQGKISVDYGGGFSYEKNDTSYSLGIGYDINKNFAFELAYRDIGQIKDRDSDYWGDGSDVDYHSKVDASAFTASVLAKYPVSNQVDIFGRLGVAKIEVEQNESWNDAGIVDRQNTSDSRYRAVAGVGVSYALNEQVALRAEYNRFADWNDVTLSAFTVGATYHF